MRFDPKNTLILVALEAELPNEMIPSWNVAYTGVGKVNAALKGSEYVARYKVDGKGHRLHEVSRFLKSGGLWYYRDGEHL